VTLTVGLNTDRVQTMADVVDKINGIPLDQGAIEIIEKTATKVIYGASAGTVYCGFTINEWGIVVGIVLGVSTFVFNIWFKMKYQRH
jgi:hypothetical protein